MIVSPCLDMQVFLNPFKARSTLLSPWPEDEPQTAEFQRSSLQEMWDRQGATILTSSLVEGSNVYFKESLGGRPQCQGGEVAKKVWKAIEASNASVLVIGEQTQRRQRPFY